MACRVVSTPGEAALAAHAHPKMIAKIGLHLFIKE